MRESAPYGDTITADQGRAGQVLPMGGTDMQTWDKWDICSLLGTVSLQIQDKLGKGSLWGTQPLQT